MKFKNISIGDSVQIKKSMCHIEFKAKQVCEVIDVDPMDKKGFDVLIQGKNCLDWVHHKDLKKPIQRELEPKLKHLDQSVFDGLDDKWQWATMSSVGIPFVYSYKPAGNRARFSDSTTQEMINAGKVMRIDEHGYDTTNWQNSLIERDKVELTGSDLCRAMLERGDKTVLCAVSDDGDFVADAYDAICRVDEDGLFESHCTFWWYVQPVNNQGEPLTATDVGL